MTLPYDPNKEELYHVSGDADTGITTQANLTKSAMAQPQIRYSGKWGDYVMTAELYNQGGQLALNIICPRCHNSLWIRAERKKIEWDAVRGVSVEPFQCTWELGERGNERMDFGLGLCRWTAVIEDNRARDA